MRSAFRMVAAPGRYGIIRVLVGFFLSSSAPCVCMRQGAFLLLRLYGCKRELEAREDPPRPIHIGAVCFAEVLQHHTLFSRHAQPIER